MCPSDSLFRPSSRGEVGPRDLSRRVSDAGNFLSALCLYAIILREPQRPKDLLSPFVAQGAPLPTSSTAGGFGLGQIDNTPPPTDNDLWDWVINIEDFVNLLKATCTEPDQDWVFQLQEMNQTTSSLGLPPQFAGSWDAPYCHSDSYAPGGAPQSGYYGYDQANWIYSYNANIHTSSWINWIAANFNSDDGDGWQFGGP